jgi:hypothetical protein
MKFRAGVFRISEIKPGGLFHRKKINSPINRTERTPKKNLKKFDFFKFFIFPCEIPNEIPM